MSEVLERTALATVPTFEGRTLTEWLAIESAALDELEWEIACDALRAINELRKGMGQ